jgi:hypothetical protein
MAEKFRFEPVPGEYRTVVYYRGKKIGELHGGTEDSGRWCFTLDCDRGPKRRQFRGRLQAAEALLVIHKTITQWQRRNLSLRELVVQAWRTRPSGSGESNWSTELRSKRKATAARR